jgi:hypothetical protein
MRVSAILSITAAVIGLTSAGLTANYDDLAAKGYRWVTIDGPYGCPAKDDLQQIVKKPTDETELQMIKQHRAYYILRGDIVKLIQEDPASGISRIHVAGITTDLWTPTKFLSKRPVENAFGVVETPETSGLVPIETESITDSLKQAGVTPAPSTNSTPRSDENERP